MSDYYVVEGDSLSSVADAIREKTGKDEQLEFPDDFVSQIQDIESQGGIYIKDDEPDWTRPVEWPDLDALLDADEADDVIYYTVDNTDKDAWFGAGLTTNPTSAKKNLERGHVENGVFVVDEIKTVTSNGNMIFSFSGASEWVDYPVFRLTHETGTLTSINVNGNVTVEGIATNHQRIKVLEIACKFIGEVSIGNSLNKYSVERVRINGGKIKTLNFQDAKNLRKINAQDWDVSQITTMQNMFNGDRFLKEVKCKNWDVKKVTSFYQMFYNCARIKELDFSNWQNNIATTYAGFVRNCYSLKKILFGTKLDTSNTTAMGSFFSGCLKLEQIDLSWMNTSNVQDLNNFFYYCTSLKKIIGADHLDTSAVLTAGKLPTFQYCRSLPSIPQGFKLNLKSLTDNVTGSYIFSTTNFSEIDLSNIQYSNKIIQPFLFSDCLHLKKIDYHGWDTSNFTGLHSYSVSPEPEYVNLNGWDLTHLTTISNIWNKITIKQYWPPKISINHNYSSMYGLDHASKLRILNVLPEVSETRTLTLGGVRVGLKAEEIAIATQKGWTVA